MTIAWLFPGQGSQSVGMAKDVLAASAAARAVFERVDAALGEPLSRLILEGPEDELTLTANAQPAIVAASVAVLAAVRERIPDLPQPAFAAGHSLGEYSALVAADALSLEDAVRLVRARGRAMQDAVPAGTGAMSAVMGIEPERIQAICLEAAQGEVVSPANFNGPGQIVIAGHAAAVARAGKLASDAKGRVVPLKVSAPFHCALMAPAARVLEAELARVSIRDPRFPIVANFDARANSDGSRVKELLVRQVDGAVRWDESVRLMAAGGVRRGLEIGPGGKLAGLIKRITKELAVLSVEDAASIEKVGPFLVDG
jgi:[acyl-carrier-protein] S-malonyltransferase